ncbi:unnamed protein product [Ixodes persulcatus]
MSTEDRFHAAVEVIRGLPKNGSFQPSHDLQLKFYAYYKQATQGSVAECKVPKPRFWDIIGNAKWDAWMRLGDMSKEEAMQKYVEELVKVIRRLKQHGTFQIVEAMSYTDNVAKFMDLLGPLFDMTPSEAALLQTKLNGNRESEDDIETLEVPSQEEPVYGRADKRPEEKAERKASVSGGLNGHPSNFDSEEDEFSDTYDHMGDEDEESGSPQPREDSTMLDDAVTEALRSGTDRVLVQDSESQLWAFYADGGGKPPNGDLANVRGGGDDPQRKAGPLPKGGLGGTGRYPRGYRRREGDLGADGLPPDGRHVGPRGYPGGMGGSGGSGRGHQRLPLEVSEQLAVAVLRLQQTMDEVVARLEVLETLLQHSKAKPSRQNQRWWLFGGVAPHLLLLLLAWPVVFQLCLYLVSRRRLRQLR